MTVVAHEFYSVNLVPSADVAFYIGANIIGDAIDRSFAGAQFNSGYDGARPLTHTTQEVMADTNGDLTHAIAMNRAGTLVGAIFCIPAGNPNQQEACDIGWMFTVPEMTIYDRLVVLNGLMLATTVHLRYAGYQRIETTMGTKAGAGALKRFGFYKNLRNENPDANEWVFDLSLNHAGTTRASRYTP